LTEQKKKEKAFLKEMEEKERLEGNTHFIPTVFDADDYWEQYLGNSFYL